LSGLSGLKKKQLEQQKQQQKDLEDQEQKELQGISYIKNFYGNPKYQAAMKILNDPTLQNSYQQDLNEIEIFFFKYSQKVVSKHHTSKKSDDGTSMNVTSFLTSLHKEPKPTKTTFKKKVKVSTKIDKQQGKKTSQSSNKATSFLASLKG